MQREGKKKEKAKDSGLCAQGEKREPCTPALLEGGGKEKKKKSLCVPGGRRGKKKGTLFIVWRGKGEREKRKMGLKKKKGKDGSAVPT